VNDQTICGAFTYNIFEVKSGINVGQTLVTNNLVSGIQNRLTATTQKESDEGVHTMRLIITLGRDNYPTLTVGFQLTISQATCNCNLITWD
jgi:hypothetical protein